MIGNKNNYKYDFSLLSMFPSMYLLDVQEGGNLNFEEEILREPVHIENTAMIKSIPYKKLIVNEIDRQLFPSVLSQLKHSLWWNVHAFFLIKNVQATDSCDPAKFFLETLWKLNILQAIYFCHNSTSGIHLYTFNPYSAIVSDSWQQVGSYDQNNGHPLRLFRNIHPTVGKFLKYLYHLTMNF